MGWYFQQIENGDAGEQRRTDCNWRIDMEIRSGYCVNVVPVSACTPPIRPTGRRPGAVVIAFPGESGRSQRRIDLLHDAQAIPFPNVIRS